MTNPKHPRRRSLPGAACVLACNLEGEILVVGRKEDPDLFCMPGGKVEDEETFLAAAARELREETGMQIPVVDLVEVYRGECEGEQCYDTTAFLAVSTSGSSVNQASGAEWVDPAVLLNDSPFQRFNQKAFKEARDEVRMLASWMRLDPQDADNLKALEESLTKALDAKLLQASIGEWVALPRKLTAPMWKAWEETFFVTNNHKESWESMISMAPKEGVDSIRLPREMTPSMQAAWEDSHNRNDSYQADFDAAMAAAPPAPDQRPKLKGP